MATRTPLPLVLVASATALLACTETLRLPPPASGAAGAPASDSHEYAPTAPAANDGGLVSSGGGGAPGMSSGGSGASGFAAMGGGAMGGPGTAGTVGTGPMATPPPGLPSAPWVPEGRGIYAELKTPPLGMSRDGHRVLESDGLWIDEAPPTPTVTPTVPQPVALSADGTTVVGEAGSAPCQQAAFWARGIETTAPIPVNVAATSADGHTIVGTAFSGCAPIMGVFVLSFSGSGVQHPGPPIGPLAGDDSSEALGVSADGATVIGFSSNRMTSMGRLFSSRLAAVLPMHDTTIKRPGFALLTSSDGSAVAGTLIDAAGLSTAFLWRRSTSAPPTTSPLQPLPRPASRGQSIVFGLSDDGAVVLALGTNAPSSSPVLATQDGLPFTWSDGDSGPRLLQLPPPVIGLERVLMTPDASLIVGDPTPNPGMPVVVWDKQRVPGFVFADAPMFLQRCHPVVTNVSADGKAFSGSCDASSRRTGFVARFP